jgi:hypothetical protein
VLVKILPKAGALLPAVNSSPVDNAVVASEILSDFITSIPRPTLV